MSEEDDLPASVGLERLWSGPFGDEYTERNAEAAAARGPFWERLLGAIDVATVLEVGCNRGANLEWIVKHVDPRGVVGVDVNVGALKRLRVSNPSANALYASARVLPFRDRSFDLAFTMGVLIHVAPEVLPVVMAEIVRCSNRYVLCGEYYSEDLVDVPYRGHSGALYKHDYGGLYASLFPELELVESGFLSQDEGWDDVTWWLFRRP